MSMTSTRARISFLVVSQKSMRKSDEMREKVSLLVMFFSQNFNDMKKIIKHPIVLMPNVPDPQKSSPFLTCMRKPIPIMIDQGSHEKA